MPLHKLISQITLKASPRREEIHTNVVMHIVQHIPQPPSSLLPDPLQDIIILQRHRRHGHRPRQTHQPHTLTYIMLMIMVLLRLFGYVIWHDEGIHQQRIHTTRYLLNHVDNDVARNAALEQPVLGLGLVLRHHPRTALDDIAMQNRTNNECKDPRCSGPAGLECIYFERGAW